MSQPLAQFVSPVDMTVSSTSGHTAPFKAGVPRSIPVAMHIEALEQGCAIYAGESAPVQVEPVAEPVVDAAPVAPVAEPVVDVVPADPAVGDALTDLQTDDVADVISAMLLDGSGANFDRNGKVSLTLLNAKLSGFKVTAKQRDSITETVNAG